VCARALQKDISTDPVAIEAPALATFLQHDGSELSFRATAGFLSRTRTAKLRFPEGFIAAVEKHLRNQTEADISVRA
jgi:DNA (cytosine-5)-methyltransferase 1